MRATFDLYAQRIPLRGGDEFDAFTTWRRVMFWHRGERRRKERIYHHRWRRLVHLALKLMYHVYKE